MPPLNIVTVKHIRFEFENSIFDCNLRITDEYGVRDFNIPIVSSEEDAPSVFETDVYGDFFEVALVPVTADLKSHMNEFRSEIEQDGLKGKFIFGLLSKAFSALEGLCLRVGCRYRVLDIPDDALFSVRFSGYVHGNFILSEIFEVLPICYMYYELIHSSRVFEPTDAYSLNRRELISSSRKLALINFGLECLIRYPLQVKRAKILTKDKKVKKSLKKFYGLTPKERQKKMDKWDKIL